MPKLTEDALRQQIQTGAFLPAYWLTGDEAYIRIVGNHTNVVELRVGDEILIHEAYSDEADAVPENRDILSVDQIIEFADTADLSDVKEFLDREIRFNMAIAEEGLRGHYGAEILNLMLREDQKTPDV